MIALNLPSYEYKVIKKEEKLFIFDDRRRKYVSLTPEEWVRQNFVNFLINHKYFPAGRIGNEVTVILNGMKKRADSVVYDQLGVPFVIVEYKAPSVKITQEVFDQIVRYNMVMKVKYLIVTNGLSHYCCEIDYTKQSYIFLKEIPIFTDL
ncbi:MAG: type I restriction enzyme HsdR N-terminal domain-containing protein [Bacteroidales bacterium]